MHRVLYQKLHSEQPFLPPAVVSRRQSGRNGFFNGVAALFLMSGLGSPDCLAATLAVKVVTDQGDPLPGIEVAAVTSDPVTHLPNATLTQVAHTASDGQVSFQVPDQIPYTIIATAVGYTPTPQMQLNDPENTPLQGEGTLQKRIIFTPGLTHVGHLQASLKLSTVPGLILAAVELQKTKTVVASRVQRFTTAEGVLSLPNVPPAPAGTYLLTVYEAQSGRALSLTVSEEALVGHTLALGTLDFTSQTAVVPSTRNPLPNGGPLSFEGIVLGVGGGVRGVGGGINEGQRGQPLVEAKVLVTDLRNPKKPPRVSLTDANGRYEVFDLPPSNYTLLAIANGYEGVLDNSGGNGHPVNGSRLVRHFDGSSGQNPALQPARGTVSGVVRWGGQPLSDVEVVVAGDERIWSGTDRYAGSSAARGEGRQRTASNGTFTLSGLGPGNYSLYVTVPWLRPNVWNWGPNQWPDDVSGGIAVGDDRRLTVAKMPEGTWQTLRYTSLGEPITAPFVIDLLGLPGTTAPTGQVKGTIRFPHVVTLSSQRPVIIQARQVSSASGDPAAIATAVVPAEGNATGSAFPFSMALPLGGVYVLDVHAPDYGMVQHPGVFRYLDLTQASSVNDMDIPLGLAGRLTGVVRFPDGSLFRAVTKGTLTDRLCQVKAEGESVASYGIADVGETGHFEVTGLLPGRYTLRTLGSGDFPWANATLQDVVVAAGATTQVELPLPAAVPCRPTVPASALRLWPGARGGLTVVAIPAGQSYSAAEWRGLLLGYDAPAEFFLEDDTTFTIGYLAPGRTYHFFFRYIEEYGPAEDGFSSPYPSTVILGVAKNVSLSLDTPKTGAPPVVPVPIPAKPLVLGGIRGQVTGRSPFSAGDLKLFGQGIFTLLIHAPILTMVSPSGDLKALAQAVPHNQSSNLRVWQHASASGDPARIQDLMTRFPLGYRVIGLPAETYTATLVSPSLPPVTSRVQVSGITTWDVPLDREVTSEGRWEGRVTDANTGQPLAEAWVTLKTRLGEWTARTDAAGYYTFEGLAHGVYRVTISKSGYALGGAKRAIQEGAVKVDNQLVPATGSFSGKVLTQTVPFPQAAQGVKVVAYDDTQNGLDPTGFLPLYTALTDANGGYLLEGIQENHTYKIAALAPGKAVTSVTKVGTKGQLSAVNLLLRSAPPPLTLRAQPQGNHLMITMTTTQSLKTPPSLDTPTGPLSMVASGPHRWGATLTQFPIGRDIPLKVTLDDGGPSPYTVSGTVNSEERIRTQLPLIQEVAMGGTVEVHPDDNDFSGVEVPVGGLTEVPATAAERALRQPLGGSLEKRPQLRVTKFSPQQSTALATLPRSSLASEAVQIDLANTQLNRPLMVTVKYDPEQAANPKTLTMGQYHEPTRTWQPIPGVVSVDPFLGTVSMDISAELLAAPTSADTPQTAGLSLFTGTEFRPRPNAAATHSGLFVVFQGLPPTNVGYVGSTFNVYNFPNPFSLQSKTLTLRDGGGLGPTLSTDGTIIRYELPTSMTGEVDFLIYTLAGEVVRELHEGSKTGGFVYYTTWDGKNASGTPVASGVYFAIAKVNHEKVAVFKLAVLK